MNSHETQSDLVDWVRGDVGDPLINDRIAEHVGRCRMCNELVEQQRALTTSLRRLADDLNRSPFDGRTENELLERFDAYWAGPRSARRAWALPGATAAVVVCGLVGGWTFLNGLSRHSAREASVLTATTRNEPNAIASAPVIVLDEPSVVSAPTTSAKPRGARRREQQQTMDFVAWPGSARYPRLDNGELVRVELPAAVLPALGLYPPDGTVSGFVTADIVVGQDGFARAVRLSQ